MGGFGFAFHSHGNFGSNSYEGGGGGPGASTGSGLSFQGSNADNICELKGLFGNGSAQAGNGAVLIGLSAQDQMDL